MSNEHAAELPVSRSMAREPLIAFLSILVRAAREGGDGAPFNWQKISLEERKQLEEAGIIEEIQASKWRLTREAEEAALSLLQNTRPAPPDAGAMRPWYDGDLTLYWNNLVVKRWKRLAHQQKKVVLAFQAAGWPPVLAAPFGPQSGSPLEKLRDTRKSLNRRIVPRTIRFYVAGINAMGWREDRG